MAEATTTTTPPLHNTHRNFFGQINVAIIGMSYYFSQQEQFNNFSSCHAGFAFIVPLLLNFIQLKYQNMEIYPFETHPKSMGIAVASLLLYCFAYDAEVRSSASNSWHTYQFLARRSVVVFGWLAVVSLASILLPDSVGPLLYLLYILFLAGEFLPRQLQMLWKWVHQIIMGRVPLMPPSHRLTAHSFSNTGAIPRPRV